MACNVGYLTTSIFEVIDFGQVIIPVLLSLYSNFFNIFVSKDISDSYTD